MQLNLFSQPITFRCVKVVNSKRGKKENKVFFQDQQAALDARECSRPHSGASTFALKLNEFNFPSPAA